DAAEPSSSRPARGDELELEIGSLAFGGEGVARVGDSGYVVFVAGAVPGDRVRALVYKRKRSYAHARTLEVLEPSPERIPPLADHPGVPWQVLRYERQLQIKAEQVSEALARLGRLSGFEQDEIAPALEQWRYRNKLEYSFGADSAGEVVCGFHAPAGGRSVAPIGDCLLASERGNEAREVALAWCREQRLSAWERSGSARDERTGPGADGRARLRNLVVREGRASGALQVRLVTTEGELDGDGFACALAQGLGADLSGVLWTRSRSLAETTAGGETELLAGEPQLRERLGELDLRISPEAFFQTNTEMAHVLYGIAADCAALEGWERVYDLYSGIGSIALTLAPRAGELWGIELIEPAVEDAIAGARRNEIANARFFAGDVRTALPELLERAGRPDVIVVDPPRAGLSKKVVHRIIDAAPKRVVYVSCNPTTLAPNAAELSAAGLRLRSVRPVDMFPQTPHIECVALFERG
ncbi:MAG TPA: 23S rRNA (uracil(1939)-C(5))-methyltransferase RlmD, partial [Solirubrobacteraceae bacterium]|nr:23S rRNA (uracil(1939)-C(5))-methyltransferase RlmD [Solirubrobacteraceae bacterium]